MKAMKKYIKKLFAYALLVVLGFSGAVSSGGNVLCVGDDGHSRIEQAIDSCCLPIANLESNKSSAGDNHQDAECGDCNDIEVSDLLLTNRSVERSDCKAPLCYALINYLDSRALTLASTFDKHAIFVTLSPTIAQLVVTTAVLII